MHFLLKAGKALSSVLLLSVLACQPETQEASKTQAQTALAQEALARFEQHIQQLQEDTPLADSSLTQLTAALDKRQRRRIELLLQSSAVPSNVRPQPIADSIVQASPDSFPKVSRRRAALLMQVRDESKAYKEVITLASSYEAEVMRDEEVQQDTRTERNLLLRVPTDKFQGFVQDVQGLALRVEQKKLWQEDVSPQFVQIESRVQSKRTAQARLYQLLAQTQDAQAVVDIQAQIERLNEELGALERVLQLLAQSQAYHKVLLSFYQELQPLAGTTPTFKQRAEQAFKSGWSSFKETALYLTAYWPFLLLGSLVFLPMWFGWRAARRRRKRFRPNQVQPPVPAKAVATPTEQDSASV